MADTENQQEPTAEEYKQMQSVSEAGATAAAEGKDPAEAMKGKRDEVGLVKLDDETIDQLAAKLNELNIEGFRQAGAFDPPPEPVSPPAQPVAPPGPGEQPPADASPAQAPPQKRTPAHWFLGL